MTPPVVIAAGIASVDGRITIAPDVLGPAFMHDPRFDLLLGSEAGALGKRLRSLYRPQAILEGAGSFVRPDDEPDSLPPAHVGERPLDEDFLPDEVIDRDGHAGWFAVVDSRGRCRWGVKEQEGWHVLILCAHTTPREYLDYLRREAIPYLIVGEERVDLRMALARLNEALRVERMISEAAGRLNGALLRAGLLDELYLEVAPLIIGGRVTPSLFDSPDLTPDEPPHDSN
jgi:hypothetical protein